MHARRIIYLYLGAPTALAVYNGMRGTVWAAELSTLEAIALFLVCSLPVWALAALVSHSVLPICRRLNLHPMAAAVMGATVAIPCSYLYVVFGVSRLSGFFPGIEVSLGPDSARMIGGFLSYLKGPSGLLFSAVWCGSQFLYELATREGLFYPALSVVTDAAEPVKEPDVPHPAPSIQLPPTPVLLQKIRPDLGREILALEAQEHYVKVYTDRGEDMILYRFGDAVNELSGMGGLRVHRSFWVLPDAITSVRAVGKSYRLTLRNNLEVPVSLSHRGGLQHAGLISRV